MNATQPLAAVVFDLDGLLVNSEDVYEQADAELLRRRGKSYDAWLREQMMGRPTAESLHILVEHHGLSESIEQLASERSSLRDRMLAGRIEPMRGVSDLLATLGAARRPAAIATSGTRDYAATVLARLEIRHLFEFVLTADDITRGKPAPDVYQLAARRLGLAPHQTMVLEDSGNGCRAAIAAGAFTVAVPNRHTANHDFSGVRFVAESLADRRIHTALGLQPR